MIAGYDLLREILSDYSHRRSTDQFDQNRDCGAYLKWIDHWRYSVELAFRHVFPTTLELNQFNFPQQANTARAEGVNATFSALQNRMMDRLAVLRSILDGGLNRYTDLPQKTRLYVEDVDSFSKVRDVNPAMVSAFLANGHLSRSEDAVQRAFENILNVPFHKNDWGGELNDLYTANIIVNGTRRSGAFLLKGPGIGKGKELTIADCGKNGDQIVRLFAVPADLYVIQYVGPISELVVADAQGKIDQLTARGQSAHLLIIDGQDTARVMLAYGCL